MACKGKATVHREQSDAFDCGRSSKSHRKHYVSPHVSTDRDSLLNNVTKLPRSTFHGLGNLAGIILVAALLCNKLSNRIF